MFTDHCYFRCPPKWVAALVKVTRSGRKRLNDVSLQLALAVGPGGRGGAPTGGADRDMGEMRELIFLFVLQTEFSLSDLLLQLSFEKGLIRKFCVVLGYLDAGIS